LAFGVGFQVIAKSYNRECDMWSIGVILFTLMCGYPPFWGDTEREIYGRVKRGHYAFEGPDWHIRSAAVKELVNSLLLMNSSTR
jgi:calcium-dependent protein kinase